MEANSAAIQKTITKPSKDFFDNNEYSKGGVVDDADTVGWWGWMLGFLLGFLGWRLG